MHKTWHSNKKKKSTTFTNSKPRPDRNDGYTPVISLKGKVGGLWA